MKRILLTTAILVSAFAGGIYAQETGEKKPVKKNVVDKSTTKVNKATPKKIIKKDGKRLEIEQTANILDKSSTKVDRATPKKTGWKVEKGEKVDNSSTKVDASSTKATKLDKATPKGTSLTAQIDGIRVAGKASGKKQVANKPKKKVGSGKKKNKKRKRNE
jgi:hypothetical protein